MSRHPFLPGRAHLAAFTLLLVGGAAACEEDGKTLPATCPTLPLYDAHAGGFDSGGDPGFSDPSHCVTNLGHAVNQIGPSGGTSASTGGTGGKGAGGKSSTGGKGGTSASEGGAGGAG